VGEYRWSQIACDYKSSVRILNGRRRICRKGDFDACMGIGMLKMFVDCVFDTGGKYQIKSETLQTVNVVIYANHCTTWTGVSKI
jgi:hypothetical protein